jgi:hypothetical protein
MIDPLASERSGVLQDQYHPVIRRELEISISKFDMGWYLGTPLTYTTFSAGDHVLVHGC